MQVIQSASDLQQNGKGSFVAIGKWDGIHRGHQQLIRHIVTSARKNNCQSIVISFDRHPLSLLKPGSEPYQLQSTRERSEMLAALGVDVHLVLPFTKEFVNLSPEAFVTTVLGEINAYEVMIGYNFRFGKKRRGTPELLKTLCAPLHINVEVAPPIYIENEKVSSTLIREYLQKGEVEKASNLLGRPAILNGTGNLLPSKTGEEGNWFELLLAPSSRFIGSGTYTVKMENCSNGVSANALLLVKEKGKYFLYVKKSFLSKSSQPFRVHLLFRENKDRQIGKYLHQHIEQLEMTAESSKNELYLSI
ncbi:FAD synthetase family protein [Neobacillus cucumis]|uniref:FAD synthetase family protein n=1 Tax=Neobacillus cucumis TaxID=1740721 RepID=UPI00203DF14F|nr:FAD synthetase family protein [Neobacillus cucumis]MCM3729535.1 FAD synthetase family protein [Neobacillus cucumis]